MLTTRGWLVVLMGAFIVVMTLCGSGIELGWKPSFPLFVGVILSGLFGFLSFMCATEEPGPMYKPRPPKPAPKSHKPETF